MTLVDTDVLVDLQRGHPPAVAWIQQVKADSFSIPGVIAVELVAGSRNKAELEKSNWYLSSIRVIAVNEADFQLALDLARQHSVRGGLGLADYFIAAQAINRDATLFSFNVKHFGAIAGLKVIQPFER